MSASVVLVTGANRGIGYEIVKALVESPLPYHVFLGSRDVNKGKTAAASLHPRSGSSISVVQLDVSSSESITNAAATVKAEAGRLDVLVNNAGIVDDSPDSLTRLRNTLEINTIAPFAVTTAFKPLLTVQPEDGVKGKRLIYVSSGLGSIGQRVDSKSRYYSVPAVEYRMSKTALNMLAACDAFDLKDHGVKVFAFDPEFVATELTHSPEERRKLGALEPSVSGESCRDIIEGKRDADTCISLAANKKTPLSTILYTKCKKQSEIKAVNLDRVIYRVSHETQNQITIHILSHTKSSYALQPNQLASSLVFSCNVINNVP